MEIPAPTDCKVWAVIKFLNAEGITRSEIQSKLGNIYSAPYLQPKTWFK